jgi:hypothetical protein
MLTLTPSATSVEVGQRITFDGTVLPDKGGHVIYLQRQAKDGDWHVVEVGFVRGNSTFEFGWRFGHPGTATFRARITSDGLNVGAASDPVTVTATAAPTASLPPAS